MKSSLRKIRVSRPAAYPALPLPKPVLPAAPAGTKRVLVIEDQSAVCDLVAEMVHAHPRCNLAGKGSDGESAVELALQLRPDIWCSTSSCPASAVSKSSAASVAACLR